MKHPVKAKKSFGQHFLNNENAAINIVESAIAHGCKNILEIGPGTGVLTKHLLGKSINLKVCEIDKESIYYLKNTFSNLYIIEKDFLQLDLNEVFNGQPFSIVGNFPYNISTQIVFKILENVNIVHTCTGMFQLEVAKRICAHSGKKDYGILSVLSQVFFKSEIIILLEEHDFIPPPKVKSAVIEMRKTIAPDEMLTRNEFKQLVKIAFNQRRKTLRNALSIFPKINNHPFSSKRAEQLSLQDFKQLFIDLTL